MFVSVVSWCGVWLALCCAVYVVCVFIGCCATLAYFLVNVLPVWFCFLFDLWVCFVCICC